MVLVFERSNGDVVCHDDTKFLPDASIGRKSNRKGRRWLSWLEASCLLLQKGVALKAYRVLYFCTLDGSEDASTKVTFPLLIWILQMSTK
jgi:hypothetical protein